MIFQSTRPVWGATSVPRPEEAGSRPISIHAPRVGRDVWLSLPSTRLTPYFNPRAPCGARRQRHPCAVPVFLFQSTRPVWGATTGRTKSTMTKRYFNPRAPCGARRSCTGCGTQFLEFQSTRPVWGATYSIQYVKHFLQISIHAPRVGRDSGSCTSWPAVRYFNPRAPCGARHP